MTDKHDMQDDDRDNPMDHPDEQPTGSDDDSPKFGRLLLVLLGAVLLVGLITFASEAMYS